MKVERILNQTLVILPIFIVLIIGQDLIQNQSMSSQYFHWISFLLIGIATSSVTGKTFKLFSFNYVSILWEFCGMCFMIEF